MNEPQPTLGPPTDMTEGKMLLVTDLNCRSKPRTHDCVVNNKIFTHIFRAGEKLEMPYDQGMKFLQDGWQVEEHDGRVYSPPPRIVSVHEKIIVEPHQVIADLNELTAGALKVRVARLPGGEVAGKGQKPDLVEFLTEYNIQVAEKSKPKGKDDDGDISLDQLKGMLPTRFDDDD